MKKISIYISILSVVLMSCERIPTGVSGKENGHEYIDMGTSVMWSPVNLGATVIGEYGDYYAWGETEPKEKYSWENYKWCKGKETQLTKYFEGDNRTILELEDDAAHVRWGGTWRIPNQKEWKELVDKCDCRYVHSTQGKGFLFTAKNGNTLFFPLAGTKDAMFDLFGYSAEGSFGSYQSNGIRGTEWSLSRTITFDKEENFLYMQGRSRFQGTSIRPICVPSK